MNNLAYFLYMAETEGLTDVVNTRESKINSAIKDFKNLWKKGYNIDNPEIQKAILEKYHLNNITPEESRYIVKQVLI